MRRSDSLHSLGCHFQVLKQTYSFQDLKLDCCIPTTGQSLSMDEYRTVEKINRLFGSIDPRLVRAIVIPDSELVAGLKRGAAPQDLVTSIVAGSVFLRRTESGKTRATMNVDSVLAFLESFR